MIVLGIDPGIVNLGYCKIQVDVSCPEDSIFLDYGVFGCKSSEKDYNPKMDEESYQCLNFFDGQLEGVTHVAWETVPGFGGMGQQSRIISNMSTLKVLTWQKCLYFDSFAPITMKKQFTGSGKSEKSDIRKEAIKRWPLLDDSHKPKKEQLAPDVFDAIGISISAVERNKWKRFEGVRVS